MNAKGLRLSTLCSSSLELRRRPTVRHPLLLLVVVVCSLPCVASSPACLPCVVGRRPFRATTLPPTLSMHSPPPPALSHCSLLVILSTACSCRRQPLFLVLPNDAAPPLLCLLLCALVGLVYHAIRCDSIRAGPQGATVTLFAPPPGPTESLSSSSRGCC